MPAPHPVPFYTLTHQHADVADALRRAFEAFLSRQQYVLGEGVRRFEETYAAFSGTRHCVGVGNGQDALALALRALGVGAGHEVVVPAHTFVATAMAVVQAGARPVFADVDAATGLLTAATAAAALTPRARALVPVHLYGHPAPLDALLALAQAKGLAVVEDNAQAHGAQYQGRPTGSFGAAGATSFYPTKNLGALGDAGAITTNDDALATRLRKLRNYGSVEKYVHEAWGVNSRLDEWQAEVLLVKFAHLVRWTQQRQTLAALYDEALRNVPGLLLPPRPAAGTTHVWHLYVVRSERRNALQAHLAAAGIGTIIHYPVPLHLQTACRALGYRRGQLPNAERWADTALSLPLYPGLTSAHVARIADAVRTFGHHA